MKLSRVSKIEVEQANKFEFSYHQTKYLHNTFTIYIYLHTHNNYLYMYMYICIYIFIYIYTHRFSTHIGIYMVVVQHLPPNQLPSKHFFKLAMSTFTNLVLGKRCFFFHALRILDPPMEGFEPV